MRAFELIPGNPDDRVLQRMATELRNDEVIIVPTDTYYAFVCSLSNRSGIERICRLVGKKPEKANLSILCSDLKNISDYTLQFSKSIYKLMNRNLPGPFTFILRANSKVPKLFLNNRKTIGIRVPDNKITQKLLELNGEPLVAASVHHPSNKELFLSDPVEIELLYGGEVNWLIDGGLGAQAGSAVIDCTGEEPELIREGPREIA